MKADTCTYWRFAGIFPISRETRMAIAHMDESRMRELQQQNRQFYQLLVSLSATLLRKVATESARYKTFTGADAECFIDEAQACFRCARIPGLRQQIAEGLEVAGHELMAMAVDIETGLPRLKGGTKQQCDY